MKEDGKDVVKEEGRRMKNKRQDGRFTVTVTGLKVLLKGGYCPDEFKRKSCLQRTTRKTHKMENGHPGAKEKKASRVILTSRSIS